MKEQFRERLIKALRDKGVPEHGQGTWLAQRMGVTPKAANKWLNAESMPAQSKWWQLARILNKSKAYFYEGYDVGKAIVEAAVSEPNAEYSGGFEEWDSFTETPSDEVELPFYTEISLAAGTGTLEAHENMGPKLRFAKSTLRRQNVLAENAVCVRVSGNSMEPVLPDGSTVGIDTSANEIKDGKLYAINHDGMLRVKILYRMPGPTLRIRSYNEAEYPEEVVRVDGENIKVIGRVFWYSVLI